LETHALESDFYPLEAVGHGKILPALILVDRNLLRSAEHARLAYRRHWLPTTTADERPVENPSSFTELRNKVFRSRAYHGQL
jgi:hypothetical protein